MSIHICSRIITAAALVLFLFTANRIDFTSTESVPVPLFAFSWSDEKGAFHAGDIATVRVVVLGHFDNEGNRTAFNPTLTVNSRTGNSSYISGVSSHFTNDISDWRMTFVPIMNGLFSLIIVDKRFRVLDSSLHFTVHPGKMYPSASPASWRGLVNEFVAGGKAAILLLPKDAFGNNISTNSQEPNPSVFKVSAFYDDGSIANLPNVTYLGWNNAGYVSIEFIVTATGNLSLRMEGGNQTLSDSPLLFTVRPGPLDVSSCLAKRNFETSYLQIFSKMEIFLHQHDRYGNLVPGLHEFDAEVVEKGTNLSLPVADLYFTEMVPGIQLFSFSMSEAGSFMLTISDMMHNTSISNMPLEYTVFVGYCDGPSSVVNGSGLSSSVAGVEMRFSVYLEDIYQYPSPVELEKLRVQIVRKNDSLFVSPSIHPMLPVNGSEAPGELRYRTVRDIDVGPSNTPIGNPKVHTSVFEVIYTPFKSGIYEIFVFCGNIPLHSGRSFVKEVGAGEVNTSLSGFVRFSPKVAKSIKNEIVMTLIDSFNNPVLSHSSRLKLEIASSNSSLSSSWKFVDNNDGSYTAQYVVEKIGKYKICALFDGKHLSPCPVEVNSYSREYFPRAYDDLISVWEEESISFDVLVNDYCASGNARIIEYSKPYHGSLIQHGQLFRYTPYKDFFGNDYFSYTTTDVNGNFASGSVNISVLITPPQFIPFSSQLVVTEDMISPRHGGFTGFEIAYSDLAENISVIFNAQSGTMLLSPMLMQFWQPMGNAPVAIKGVTDVKDLILEGPVEFQNFAVQSIQYFGNQDFYGNDIIRASTINRNGMTDMNVSVFVEPVNDPPFVRVPEYIILNKSNGDATRIFDPERDKFEFSVGDPDLLHFPGGESGFMVMFSVEVDSGVLMTNLPAELINYTELKLENTYQWQPLQTFVTISKRSTVRAKGVRLRGPIKKCNVIMQELFYDGGEHGAVLKIALNDMGSYGRYNGTPENVSMPLFAMATVKLIRRAPISSRVAHGWFFDTGLGSAIVIESVLVFSLGLVLLFFTCKCAAVLVKERRSHCHEGTVSYKNQPACLPGRGAATLSPTTVLVKERRGHCHEGTVSYKNQPACLPGRGAATLSPTNMFSLSIVKGWSVYTVHMM